MLYSINLNVCCNPKGNSKFYQPQQRQAEIEKSGYQIRKDCNSTGTSRTSGGEE